MDSFNSLFKKEHRGELFLAILIIIYLVMGFKTPASVANMIDTIPGKVVIFIIVVFLFTYYSPILGILGLFVAFTLMRSSSMTTGNDALQKYVPTEEKRSSQFTAYNQFPYTLEQEIVAKMAPILTSGTSMEKAPYKPTLDNLHYASPLK
jgi:MFS superfamily sulfate permease-like transporter